MYENEEKEKSVLPFIANSNAEPPQQPTSIIDRLSKEIKHKEKKLKETKTNTKIQIIKAKFFLLSYVLLFTLYLLVIKILVLPLSSNPSSIIIVFFIGVLHIIISSIFMKIDHIDISKPKMFNKKKIDELLIRSFIEYLKNVFIVLSLKNMRLAPSITIFFLSPTIRTYITLKQKMDRVKKFDKLRYALGFLVCFVFLFQTFSQKEKALDNYYGTIFAMIVALFFAVGYVTDQKTCFEFHPYIIMFTSGIFAVSLGPIWMSCYSIQFSVGYYEVGLMCMGGLCNFLSFYFRQKNMKWTNISNLSSLNYLTILLGYAFGFLVLEEGVTMSDLLGSVITGGVHYFSNLRLESSENEDDL